MSDDIEELVSNLTLAVKNTLEPYVKKLNMDKERNIIITNLLKSLPEYKEMEHELKTLKEKTAHAAADEEAVPVLHRRITDDETQTCNDNTKDASTQTCEDTAPKTQTNTNDTSTNTVPKAQTCEDTQTNTNDVLTPNTNTTQPITAPNTNTTQPNTTHPEQPNTTPNTQPGVIGGVNPLKLNVIEKEVSVVEDVDNKVKEIYTEANVCSVNNILRNSEIDTIKVLKLPSYDMATLYINNKVSQTIDVSEEQAEQYEEQTEEEEDIEYEDEEDIEDQPTDNEEEEEEVVERTQQVEHQEQSQVHVEQQAKQVEDVVERTQQVEQVEHKDEEEEDVVEEQAHAKQEQAKQVEEEEELFAVNIQGFECEFYTSDELNGDIYEVEADGEVGKLLGKFKNGKPVWTKK